MTDIPTDKRSNAEKSCYQWRLGTCRFGARCKFKHVEGEKGILRPSVVLDEKDVEHPEDSSESEQHPESSNNTSTNPLSDIAEAASSQTNIRLPGSTSAISRSASSAHLQGLCKHWSKDGKCPFGLRCKFIHKSLANSQRDTPSASSPQHWRRPSSMHVDVNPTGNRGNVRQAQTQSQEHTERRLAIEKLVLKNAERTAMRDEERARVEKEKKQKEEAEREAKAQQDKAERELRERREAEQRSQKEEAARRQKEKRDAQKKRAREMQQARLRDEERLAREKAERDAALRAQLKARNEREAAVIEQYIVSESSLVTCAAGLDIRQVVSGFDLCRITIRNLPNDTKRDEIADIFTQQGVPSSDFFILELRPAQRGAKREAIVVANVDQGQNIAIGLEGIEFRNETLAFELSANASWNDMTTSTQNDPFLTVSWWAPSETVIVTYPSDEEARRQVQRLNGQTWNGRRIRAKINEYNGARHFASSAEVKILGCSPGTAYSSGFQVLVETDSFRLLNAPNYVMDDVFECVRQYLRAFPGVRMDTYTVLNNGTRVDAEARIRIGFDDWDGAKRAHDTMDKKRLRTPNFPLLRSWLPKPLQYSIKITRLQYQAQKKQWDELSERKLDRNAHIQTRVGDRGEIFIRVLGQDKKATGSLKVRVEGMVAGEKLDATHWHPSFASPWGKSFLNRVQDAKKVFVRNDLKAQCLRACGEAAGVEEAKQMIKEEVDRLAGMETTRMLDSACVRGFMREGLGKLKELIGDDNVAMNVTSIPYRVTVKGGPEATHHLQRLMDEARTTADLTTALPADIGGETCPICTDDVSNGEQLGCGHTYCSGCFSHFLVSALDNKKFPLVCMGNDGGCGVPISIPAIRRFLPPQLFENLVEAAFMAYLDQHPQELKYCTTPDCRQIYRRHPDKTLLKCPACFSTICPVCDEEAHEGMTCEERRIHRDPALQDRLNEELARNQGFKKCPQCSIFIEKTEGCNHMTCKCGAHICWKCMRIFTAGTIYEHLNTEHNGIYDAQAVPGRAIAINVEGDEEAEMAAQIRELQRFELMQQLRPVQPPVHDVRPNLPHDGAEILRARRERPERLAWEERMRREAEQEQQTREQLQRQQLLRQRQAQQARERLQRQQVERERVERERREAESGWCVVM